MKEKAFTPVPSGMWCVVTADQVDSRHRDDGVPVALHALAEEVGPRMRLAFDRTTGDEIQGLTADPDAVVRAVLTLSHLGGWRIGVGVGTVEMPLPASTREARGGAYLAAREAIDQARRHATAIAVTCAATPPRRTPNPGPVPGPPNSDTSPSLDTSSSLDTSPGDGADATRTAGNREDRRDEKSVSGALYGEAMMIDTLSRRTESAFMALRALVSRRTPEGWQAVQLIDSGLSNRGAAARLGISESAMSQRLARALRDEVSRTAELAAELLGELVAAQARAEGLRP